MKTRLMVFAAMLAICAPLFAEVVTSPMNFQNDVNFDVGCNWKIQGTKVTASASELNTMDGITASVTELNVWDGTVEKGATSGTSKYKLYFTPGGSAAGDLGRTDMIHVGGTNDCQSISNAVVGAYISLGRAAMFPTDAKYPDGNFDTALRVDSLNRATNEASMGIRGGHIKAKNYSGGIVGYVRGLFVEAINDGTDTAGGSYVLGLGTDSSTVDYGIDMDEMAAPAVGEIRFSNGLILQAAGTGAAATNLYVVAADRSTTNRITLAQ